MACQDPLKGEICKLLQEFVIPKNVLPVLEHRSILEKTEIELIGAKTSNDGPSSGTRLLFDKLSQKRGWFDTLQSVLCDKDVKLNHIADIITKEQKRIKRQPASYRISRYTSYSESMPTLSDLYIEYNRKLVENIRELFLVRIGDPVPALNVFRKFSDKVLTTIDIDNVKAEVRNNGDHEGAILLFKRLVLYDSWPDILCQVFNDGEIRKPDVAKTIGLLASKIKGDYEKQVECLYQMNERLQLSDNRMETDSPRFVQMESGRGRPLHQDELETDSPEIRPAAKRQARSCENKENTFSDGAVGGRPDVAPQRASSEDRDGTAGKPELMCAAASGNLGSLLCAIVNGADLNETDSKGRTALMYAVQYGHFKCVQELVSKGCDVDKRDMYGCTALMISADQNVTSCLQYLIERNADVDNANVSGSTALMVAAKKGYVDCLRLLIKKGCDIDKCHSDGRTALMYAAFHGHSDCVNLLIQSGCDVNKSDTKGTTALMFAAKGGQVECVNLLINGRTNVDSVDEEGNTAVMYAVLSNQIECLKVLVDKADVNITNNHGYSPLAVAATNRHKRCMKILSDACGDR